MLKKNEKKLEPYRHPEHPLFIVDVDSERSYNPNNTNIEEFENRQGKMQDRTGPRQMFGKGRTSSDSNGVKTKNQEQRVCEMCLGYEEDIHILQEKLL